jgi:hypothetical protein
MLPHPISLRYILILSSHIYAVLPSGFPTRILCIPLLPHTSYMLCSSYPPRLDLLIISGEEYKLCSSLLCSFLQPPVTSSLFGPNILLSTLFSNTFSVCSSLREVSHP